MKLRSLVASALLATTSLLGLGCDEGDRVGANTDDVTDVKHTDVEQQSIGNCWLYAEASWVESMQLSATGTTLDVSQSYWSYWHWFKQIQRDGASSIETGGFMSEANEIILERGLVVETAFVREDAQAEMSSAQSRAESKINQELSTGRLATRQARSDGALVRKIMDEAWGLKPEVRAWMDAAFGTTGARTFRTNATKDGTPVQRGRDVWARYPRLDGATVKLVDVSLEQAIQEWKEVVYPSSPSARREFQIRVQRALHAGAPVLITWLVDFNAMESQPGSLQGSFNTTTLRNAGKAGSQGGHMTVLEDYQVMTQQYGLLAAGVTLDPTKPTDAAKLAAALLPSSTVQFFRVKNSWGALRDERSSVPGFPGYHDLHVGYLNGPITWCEGDEKGAACSGSATPLQNVVLPPGF